MNQSLWAVVLALALKHPTRKAGDPQRGLTSGALWAQSTIEAVGGHVQGQC